jgi:hypothetical protein
LDKTARRAINDDDVDRLFSEALAVDRGRPGPGVGFRQRVCRLAQKARQMSQIVSATPLDPHALSPATIEAGYEQLQAQNVRS